MTRCVWCERPTEEPGPEPACPDCRKWLFRQSLTMRGPDWQQQDQDPGELRPVIELKIREAHTTAGARYVEATAVPIGLPWKVDGEQLVECFDPGCFRQATEHPDDTCFADGHGRERATRAVVGRGVRITEESPERAAFGHLRCVFRLARTQAADEVWSAIQDGMLRDCSIGFRELEGRWGWSGSEHVRHYSAVRLWHVACVDHGAYHPHAQILRAWQEGQPDARQAPAAPPAEPPTMGDVEALCARLRVDPVSGASLPPPAPAGPPQRLQLGALRRLRVALHQDPGHPDYAGAAMAEELSEQDLEQVEAAIQGGRRPGAA